MVTGLDKFREKFRNYTDCYTVIGGTACDILMGEADAEFRATKDIDLIVLIEDRYKEFAKVFWEYIREGAYRCGWRNNDQAHFYRFTEPAAGYPSMIELFSRKPDYHLETETGIIPIHIDEDTSSLSAILLNDDFYSFMLEGRRVVDGVAVLGAEYLIPFKMYAWLDLNRKKAEGDHVNTRDLKKHKNDVFRLLQIVTAGTEIVTAGLVRETIVQFLNTVGEEEIHPEQLGLNMTRDEALFLLHQIYGIE